MTTKIDISSLDVKTQEKVKVLGDRAKEIQKGVSDMVSVSIEPIKFEVEWDDGNRCDLVDFDDDEGCNGEAIKAMNHIAKVVGAAHKEFKKKIDAEIKTIINFSDSLAKKLGVDKTQFWDDHFLY